MKLHRYFVDDMELTHDFWMKDINLFHQWTRVLRYQEGREVVLFNSEKEERLYKILKIGNDAIHVELVTELEPKLPKTDLYLCFSLLKKDKNDWILQKATELGARHFVPLLTDRTEKTGFDIERAQRIVIEASEQCGRTDIPRIREPITPEKVVEELYEKVELFIAEQSSPVEPYEVRNTMNETRKDSVGILIGPEGGWTDEEKQFFKEKEIKHLNLNIFTLRAETAAITAASILSNV
jgi:16S rRNA (uracil1498-N3)-methyltransferase